MQNNSKALASLAEPKDRNALVQQLTDQLKGLSKDDPKKGEIEVEIQKIQAGIEKYRKESVGNLATIQSSSDAFKNLLAAGIKPEPANVKMAQLFGVHEAGKVASANDSDLVSNVLGLDAVQQFGVHRIGDLKNTLANLDLAGPKEEYTSKVADITPTTDDNTATEAMLQTQNEVAQNGNKTVEAIHGMSDKIDILIAAATKGNNINRYNGRAGLA